MKPAINFTKSDAPSGEYFDFLIGQISIEIKGSGRDYIK